MCPIPPDSDAAPRAPEDGAPLDAVADQPSEAAPHGMPARVLEREAVRLHARYPEVGDVATARTVLAESYATLSATSRHPEMLATTSVRHAADRLRAMAIAQGSIESRHPRVLFVCHGNAGRSQMAAALLENRSAGAVKARSAGTSPAGEIIPTALDAMTEAGIPLHHAYPKGLDEDVLRTTELVVLFDGADPFEIPAGAEVRRWSVPSIRGLGIEQVRSVRDALDLQVRELIADLEERAAA